MKQSITIIFFILILSCKSSQKKTVRKNITLSKTEYNKIKKDKEIINELYYSVIDSIKTSLLERRLDSFFLKNYTRNELLNTLEFDRDFKGMKNEIDRRKKVDTAKQLHFESADSLKSFMRKQREDFNKSKDSL